MGQHVSEEAHCVSPVFIKFHVMFGNPYLLWHSLHSVMYYMYVCVCMCTEKSMLIEYIFMDLKCSIVVVFFLPNPKKSVSGCFYCVLTCNLCYQVVTNPIDLLKLQQKLKTDEYEDVDELTTDVQLMVNNAKAFYKVIASNPLLTFFIYSLFKLNLFGECSGGSTVC